MLLEGKKLLITGVLTPQSIAFAAAKSVQEHGGQIVLTNFGRTVSITQKVARRLPDPPDVLEMDANSDEQIAAVRDELTSRWGRLDGFLHAIAFAPQDALGGNFLHTPWESVATTIQTSAYSLKALAAGLRPCSRLPSEPRSSRSISTGRSPGRFTTGWVWRRRASRLSRATSPGTSARRGSA